MTRLAGCRRALVVASIALLGAACAAPETVSPPLAAPPRAVAVAPLAPRADVTIRAGEVLVGDAIVVPLRPDRTPAVETRSDGLYIPPLGDALAGQHADSAPLALALDPTTPFGLLEAVLYTAAQSDRVRYRLRTLGTSEPVIPALSPRMRPPQQLGLTVIVVADGISLKGRGGNVAPGCTNLGPGLAVPKASGAFDLVGLRSCVQKLKEMAPNESFVTVSAQRDLTYRELVPILMTLRGGASELFHEVVVGLR